MKPSHLQPQSGLALVEILIVVIIGGILMVGIQGLLGTALSTESSIREHNASLQQGRFAMQLMVQSVRMTRRLMIPLAENPATAYSESVRDVLAVTLDPTMDRDGDGWADANNDKDYLDVNNNGSRDPGEPERVDEDTDLDQDDDGLPGIGGIDDDGDGVIDEGNGAMARHDDDEDGQEDEDSINGLDDDGDSSTDEDLFKDMNNDGKPGIINVDDDFDGVVDEGDRSDDDEDGLQDEDWFDPVVYFLSGTTLIQRIPNINPADGGDFQENPIAENVSFFQVKRIPASMATLVEISLTVTPADGEPATFNTRVRVGSGL